MIILSTKGHNRRIAIASNSQALLLKAEVASTGRLSCSVEVVPKKECIEKGFEKLSDLEIYAFIGLIEIDGLLFIGTITGKREVAQPIPETSINRVLAVDFFCLNSNRWDGYDIDDNGYPMDTDKSKPPPNKNDNVRHPCWALMKLLSNGSFYFSNEFDLTSSLQNRGFYSSGLNDNVYDEKYMWNNFMMIQLIGYRDRLDSETKELFDTEGFITSIIRGYCETAITYINDFKVGMTIISRESFKRTGYKNRVRGTNDDGETADFIETEFIMYSGSFCYAYTQIRGSVPLFWEQKEYSTNPKIHITRALEATKPVFERHMTALLNTYGHMRIVNLLSTKSDESELNEKFHELLSLYPESCEIIDFDLKREYIQDGIIATKRLIPMVLKFVEQDGYYSYYISKHRTLSEQQGIFRTNCLDCLGRTNLAQQIISMTAFRTFLEDSQIIKCSDYIEDKEFFLTHNKIWENNGLELAKIHTGNTNDNNIVQKKSKLSLSSRFSSVKNSVNRKYFKVFTEEIELDTTDLLLGRKDDQYPVEIFDLLTEFVNNGLRQRISEYSSYRQVSIFVGSYNASGKVIDDDLTKWLLPIEEKFKADIVVIGLQEVVEMSARSILNADESKGGMWEETIRTYLGFYGDSYLLLRIEHMTSLTLLVFAKKGMIDLVKNVEGTYKRTGFGGIAANKGAAACSLKVGESSFCFVNCHLAAGESNVDDRKNDYVSIKDGLKFSVGKTLDDHDNIFWFGDMNYRVTMPNENVRDELIQKKDGYLENLLMHDQLTQEICSGTVFHGYKEPEIRFNPTYKYDIGTELYDTSDKERTPSWTDRILYKGSNIQVLSYSDVDLLYSDHKPIYGAYRVKVLTVDSLKRQVIKEGLHKEFENLDNINHLSIDDDVNSSVSSLSVSSSQKTTSRSLSVKRNSSGSIQRRPPPMESPPFNASSTVTKKNSFKRPPPPSISSTNSSHS